MNFVVVDRDENCPIIGQQLPQQLQARRHHAQPLVMAGQVVAAHFLAQPVAQQRAVGVVIVGPALVAGVVGRVDVDALDLPAIERQERLERQQVIAFDEQVAARFLGLEVQFGYGFQGMVRHRKVMVPDDALSFEL